MVYRRPLTGTEHRLRTPFTMPKRRRKKNTKLSFDNSHAFIIGINQYKHVSQLETAVNDAKELAKRLKEKHQYTVYTLLDKDATRQGIRDFLHKTMPEKVGKKDRVLFYFAGHGIALDGEKGPEGYLAPVDAGRTDTGTLISMSDLHDALEKLQCRHGLLILDCCFAGAFKWSTGFRAAGFNLPKVIYQQRFNQYIRDPAWQVITSAASDQKAADIIDNRSLGLREKQGKHSPFALALFNALEGEADLVPKGEKSDGVITAIELYAYLRDWVEDKTTKHAKRQTPLLFNLKRHDKGQFIFLDPNNRLNLPPEPDRNPYLGLSTFTEKDAELFYGRHQVEESLRAKLKEERLVIITGATGSGKSSLIQAGLIPYFRQEKWDILPIIHPSETPLNDLDKIAKLKGNQILEKPTLLIVDQFEQLMTEGQDTQTGNEFELRLASYLERHPGLHIIIGIRSDFEIFYSARTLAEDTPEALLNWRNKWADGRFFLPPLTKEELREAIEKPATQKIMFFEPAELVQELVDEVYMAPGALPMLSYALGELYKMYQKSGRTNRALTKEDYETMGGLIGALQRRADQVYESLDKHEKRIMKNMMLRMMRVENSGIIRRKVPFVRLEQIPDHWEKDELGGWQYRKPNGILIRIHHELDFPKDEDDQMVVKVLEKLEKEAQLIIVTTNKRTGQSYVEPIHDALITLWPTSREWVREFGEDNIVLQRNLWQAVLDHRSWVKPLFSYGNEESASPPLWDTNPKLQQVQLAITDPKDEWLCKKGWGDKDVSTLAFLMMEEEPTQGSAGRIETLVDQTGIR